MEVKNGSNTHSAVMYTGCATGGDWSKTTMATSQTDGATKPTDKTQTHGTPKYRILPKLLSTKRSQKEKNNLGTTGFHVRVSPVATSTPKDKVNGRLVTSHDKVNGCVVTSQEKRAESRAKRRQYLAGECVSPSSSRTVNFPSTPEVKHVESAPKQIQKGLRPCGSPPARPNSSPPARPNDSPVSRRNSSHPARPKGSPVSRPNSSPPVRPNGSPVSRPNSSPPARPNDSPVSRPNSSPPVRPNGSPVSHQNSSPLVRPKGSPVSRPNSSPPIRPNGSPVSRPTGSPPPRPGSSSGVATTSPPVRNIRITNTTAIQDKTTDRTKTAMCKPDMKITTPNNSKSKERTTNKSDIKDTQSNKPHAKTTTTNKSPKKHLTTNTSAIKDRTENTSKLNDKCDSAVIKGITSQAALPQTKTTKPHMSTDRSLLNSCRSPQTSNNSASVTLSVATEASISPYSGYTGPNTTKTERDQKTAHDSGETESTTTPVHRLLVGRDGGASPRLLHDFVNCNTAMARTVSHNEALGKSATSGGDADWTGSAPEQVGTGKTRMNYTSPDEPRIDVHNDGTSDRRWTSTRVVRSRSDVFSCGHTSRPIVNDCVKLTGESCSSKFGERCRPQLPPPPPPTRASLSADDIDTSRLILLSTRRSFTFSDRNSSLRSSFMQPKSPPSDQTKGDPECSDSKPDVTMSGDTGIYSLPQPQCYSEDTMKAIKQITDKYDTLQRRRLQAMSFRETGRRKPSDRSLASTASGAESDPAIAESAVVSGDRSASTDAVDRTTDDTFDAEEEVSLSAGITQRDIARLELFYGSRDTEVAICRCLADVLFNEKSAGNHRSSPTGWRHTHTGVPLLILNTGRGNRKRDLRVVLAERETAFGLWNEKITYLSNYTSHEGAPAFHTMQHSSRPIGDLVGLRFYDAAAAETFHARFLQMTADPTDELWRVGASGHRKSSTKTRWRLRGRSDASSSKPRTKRDISQPCNFAHVTNVKQLEPGLMSSLADMISRTVARRVVGRSSTSRPSSYSSVASST